MCNYSLHLFQCVYYGVPWLLYLFTPGPVHSCFHSLLCQFTPVPVHSCFHLLLFLFIPVFVDSCFRSLPFSFTSVPVHFCSRSFRFPFTPDLFTPVFVHSCCQTVFSWRHCDPFDRMAMRFPQLLQTENFLQRKNASQNKEKVITPGCWTCLNILLDI